VSTKLHIKGTSKLIDLQALSLQSWASCNDITEKEKSRKTVKKYSSSSRILSSLREIISRYEKSLRLKIKYSFIIKIEAGIKTDCVLLQNTEDLDNAFIKRMIECDKHALDINDRYVKDRLDCIEFLETILQKEDPEKDGDVDIQAAFAFQKELRKIEGDIRKRLHVPFPNALFPELDKDTPFMVSLIRGVPEEQQERYLLTVLKWSRAARKHKEVD
jgi:hypothetical protein